MALDPKKFINSKEKTFSVLCNMKVLFEGLSERWQDKFLESLNNNAVGVIMEDERLSFHMIQKFDDFEKYFCYIPLSEENRAYVIRKNSLPNVFENLNACLTNDLRTEKGYRLN